MRKGDLEEVIVTKEINVDEKRGKRSLKNRWIDRIKYDTIIVVVSEK